MNLMSPTPFIKSTMKLLSERSRRSLRRDVILGIFVKKICIIILDQKQMCFIKMLCTIRKILNVS